MATLLQMISHPGWFFKRLKQRFNFWQYDPILFKAHYSVFCSILTLQNIFIKIIILLIYQPNRKAKNDSKGQSHVIRHKCPSLYTNESRHKKHTGKTYRVLDSLLSLELDAMGIWNFHAVVPVSISTNQEFCHQNRTKSAAQVYPLLSHGGLAKWHNFAEKFDKQVIKNRNGTVRSCPTILPKTSTPSSSIESPPTTSPTCTPFSTA